MLNFVSPGERSASAGHQDKLLNPRRILVNPGELVSLLMQRFCKPDYSNCTLGLVGRLLEGVGGGGGREIPGFPPPPTESSSPITCNSGSLWFVWAID